MKSKDFSEINKKLWEILKKNKYVIAVVIVGAVLIMWPSVGDTNTPNESAVAGTPPFSLQEQESKMEDALAKIDGAGSVSVVLTLKKGIEQVIAVDEKSSVSESRDGDSLEYREENNVTAVIVSTGTSTDGTVTLKYIYPEYQGALVVAEGAGSPEVKLRLTEAVAALTGLSTDKITVTKMKNS